MPQVSVIVPAFDAGPTIDTTVASIMAQGLRDWEAILVDDGSTDETWAKLSRFTDNRIRAVRQTNAGVSAARNRGLEHASAPYVLFLDADDRIEPDHLADLLAATAGRDDEVAYSGYQRITTAGLALQPVLAPEVAENPFQALSYSNRLATHGLLIPRNAFEQVGGFDTGLRTCEDWDLWARLARAGYAFRHVARPSAIYRMRGESLSRDFARLAEDADEVLRRCREPDPRVRSPLPGLARGHSGDLRIASAIFRLWCATAAYASGQDRELPFDAVSEVDLAGNADRLTATIKDALAIGGQAEPEALARIWNRMRMRISPALDILTAHSSEVGLRHRVVYSLERDLVRADPLHEPLRLECVEAVRRSADDLRPVITDADLVHLRIDAEGVEKLREELPGWTLLDRTTLHDKAKASGALMPDENFSRLACRLADLSDHSLLERPRTRRDTEMRVAQAVAEITPGPVGTAPALPRSINEIGACNCDEHRQRLVEKRTIPILVYRSIDNASDLAQGCVDPAAFDAQLSLLRRHGFDALNSSQLTLPQQPDAPIRGRAVVITFDEGYRDFYENAMPILDRHGFSADVFMPVGKVGGPSDRDRTRKNLRRVMNWQEIAELSARGIGFGSRLMTGTHVDALTSTKLLDEALCSRLILERKLGKEIRAVAPPCGSLDQRAIWTFHTAGYYVGYSARSGPASLAGQTLDLPRIEVRGDMGFDEFARAVEVSCPN